ncbi:MAG: hypothetical protein Q9191_007611 [Dirinaria sp. TL-2023a]
MALPSASPADNANYSEDVSNSDLRAELKRQYYRGEEEYFGDDIKYDWQIETRMFKLQDLAPVSSINGGLKRLCNKSTTFYWTPIVFACIYKAWFRCHDNHPNIDFGKFFAEPFQITPSGPQTIPDILKAHAHLFDQAISQLSGIQGGEFGHGPEERRNWRNYQLLPTSSALIALYDEHLTPPERRSDRTVSLDAEARRRSVVLVLTRRDEGLSQPISFNGIRSKSLPLARDDNSGIDSARIIRVPLDIAVQFVADLQRREDEAMSASSQQNASDASAIDRAEAFVDNILDNPSGDTSKQFRIDLALEKIDLRKRGEAPDEQGVNHWGIAWV